MKDGVKNRKARKPILKEDITISLQNRLKSDKMGEVNSVREYGYEGQITWGKSAKRYDLEKWQQ